MERFLFLVMFRVPAILIALTVHELAHAWTAKKLGDPTAEEQGRITWNPKAHLDFFGTLMLFFGPFGWAKPVPVNPLRLQNPKKDMMWIAFAGPLSNILMGFVAAQAYKYFFSGGGDIWAKAFFVYFIKINIGLSFFNLLPFPPLDGSNILRGFLGPAAEIRYLRIMSRVPMIFLILIAAEWVFHIPLLTSLLYPLFIPYLHFMLDLYGIRILFLGG